MNIAEIKQLDIVDFLRVIGVYPTKESDFSAWYHAPYREDRTPSFKVNKKRNIWYDFGIGQSGDIIDLGCLIYRTKDISQVLRMIAAANPVIRPKVRKTVPPCNSRGECKTFRDIHVGPLVSRALRSYLASRGIDMTVAETRCREIRYTTNGKEYYALAFPNEAGGYEMRNPYFKGCMSPKSITIIRNKDEVDACCLFEGFMDYLSFETGIRNGKVPIPTDRYECVVLNSVSTLSRAVPRLKKYKKIYCYMDNDDAGRKVVDFLREMNNWTIMDMMEQYPMYKDVNDLLRGKKKMP